MNGGAPAHPRVATRPMMRLAAGDMRMLLGVALLLAACSGAGQPTAPALPTFVPPGMSENPLALGAAGTPAPGGPQLGAISNYHFDVALDYAGHRVQVSQLVEVINPGPDMWTELVFFLPGDLQTARFTVSTVRLQEQVETAGTQLRFTPDGFLTLRLPQGLNPHESRLVSITYGLEAAEVELATRRPAGD
ncbi:MAG: hypothetical protein QGG60_10085, partial [Anaerolineales bacterium]|nr:hypothetical protein [Anaerolineales bacterium]